MPCTRRSLTSESTVTTSVTAGPSTARRLTASRPLVNLAVPHCLPAAAWTARTGYPLSAMFSLSKPKVSAAGSTAMTSAPSSAARIV